MNWLGVLEGLFASGIPYLNRCDRNVGGRGTDPRVKRRRFFDLLVRVGLRFEVSDVRAHGGSGSVDDDLTRWGAHRYRFSHAQSVSWSVKFGLQ